MVKGAISELENIFVGLHNRKSGFIVKSGLYVITWKLRTNNFWTRAPYLDWINILCDNYAKFHAFRKICIISSQYLSTISAVAANKASKIMMSILKNSAVEGGMSFFKILV